MDIKDNKYQITSTKLQISTKFKIQMIQTFRK